MSAHTPGPWVLRDAADGSGDIGIVAALVGAPRGQAVVAEVFADLLIAAAPELLEALHGAIEAFTRDRPRDHHGLYSTMTPAWVDLARLAIAKAETPWVIGEATQP